MVLLDNDHKQLYNAGMISAIVQKLSSAYTYPDPQPQILLLVITDKPGMDRALAQVPGANVWLVDSVNRKLLIYENQQSDFFGLRYGLEKTIEASGSKGIWNVRSAVKDKKRFPYVTVILIALNVIWFIVLSILGNPNDAQFMWSMGADYG